ncbi:S8 family serine peptidase [Streptomyces sp. NPDC090106]|uniref:S8 family serine peptidase n=1 Tax=Streptomyces sp. NPDC090106 TaxID=3365946 RepID=UPI0037F837A8
MTRGPRHSVRRRTAVRSLGSVLLPSALTATVVLGLPSPVFAAGQATVKLPVMAAELADGAGCTKASTSTTKNIPWEHQSLELAQAARISQGAGVKVGVVDTGVSTGAPTLKGRVEAVGDAGDDCVGHGTFVAGLIAAAPAKGVAFHGIAPRATVVAARGTTERGVASADRVATGIRAAVDAGAQVVEVSAAFATRSDQLDAAVVYAVEHDVLVVAAAVPDPPGSDAAATTTPAPRDYWPAASPGVLSVLDVDVQGSRPDTALLAVDADLAAPGDGVVGIGPRGSGHFVGSGASFAAAYTAGVAALVRSAYPDLSAAEVGRRLTATAYPDVVPRLDAYAAVASVSDATEPNSRASAHDAAVRLPDRGHGERATRTALLVTAGGTAVVLVVGWAALVVPRGRSRGWRPPRRG